jgi:two-component system, NtrC family, sensor kinase
MAEPERRGGPEWSDPGSENSRPGHRLLCLGLAAEVRRRVEELLQTQCDLVFADDTPGLESAKAKPPELILYQCRDSGPNGSRLLLDAKGDPRLRAVPFVTLVADHSTASRCLDAGADEFLLTSFDPEDLRARVGAAVRSYRMHQKLQAEQLDLSRMVNLAARSQARTRAILESALDGIVLLAIDGKIEGLNASAERIFGRNQIETVGKPFVTELIAPRARQAISEKLARLGNRATGRIPAERGEAQGLRRDGQEFPIECNLAQLESGSGAGLCAFVRDLTESKRMEMELQQAQKLESVGRLAAGIAHEINTPIQFVGDNTQFLRDAFVAISGLLQKYSEAARPELRAELDQIEQEADLEYLRQQVPQTIERTLQGVQRVATIVRAMKEFAHPDRREMVATDLNHAIQATLDVARNEYKYVAEVETDFGELPPVVCHAGELNQVFLNVIVNAAHAIGDVVKGTQAKGTIRVTTRRESNEVLVSISDTGTGIPETIRDKVFDQFFTTKEVGRGTGQGLAIARSIVTKHRGSITFETEPGKGTTFHIRVSLDPTAAV